jgi:Predicted ATPase with chaperone activity
MFVKLACFALHGVDAFRVELEVDLFRKGLPGFTMVGLAEISVREAKERVFSALKKLRAQASTIKNHRKSGSGRPEKARKRI